MDAATFSLTALGLVSGFIAPWPFSFYDDAGAVALVTIVYNSNALSSRFKFTGAYLSLLTAGQRLGWHIKKDKEPDSENYCR